MKNAVVPALTAIALIAQGCRETEPATSTEVSQRTEGLVTTVVDGDSIHVILGGRAERLRLIGVDAPELAHPDQPGECFGQEAALFTQQSLKGRSVLIELDVERRDRFDRLLAYVFLGSSFFNETLVARGFAIERSYPPNLAHQEELRSAEIDARKDRRGLWSACQR